MIEKDKQNVVYKMTKREEKMEDKRRKIIYYTFESDNSTEKQKLSEKKQNV